MEVITNLQIIGNRIVSYGEQTESVERTLSNEHQQKLREAKKFTGTLSNHSKRKIKKLLKIWHESIAIHNNYQKRTGGREYRRLTFITLTLAARQIHSDNEIKKKVLNRFFDELKKRNLTTHYFWRAEKQKNGNIHFHCFADRFIQKEKITETWNRAQNLLGYIDRFEQKHGHRTPPSTQVQAVPDDGRAFDYVMKYESKDEENEPVEGRLWSCDYDLSKLKPFTVIPDNITWKFYNYVKSTEKAYIYEGDYFTYIDSQQASYILKQFPELWQEYEKHYINQYNYIYHPGLYRQENKPKPKNHPVLEDKKNTKPTANNKINNSDLVDQSSLDIFEEVRSIPAFND